MEGSIGSEELDGSTIPLVAIGASAGGLEPLEDFFEAAPEDAGWAFIVIQHLSPDYKSMMDELLGRKSRLKILHIDDGVLLEPDTIYLNRPNQMVELKGRHFETRTYEPEDSLPRLPIDVLFQSLTDRKPACTVAVVLSGSGADGTKGAQALHKAGGAVIVQRPSEASFASMPRSVLTSGAVDRVLEAGQMPAAINEILDHGREMPVGETEGPDAAKGILKILEENFHIDFSAYKAENVQRRVERRRHLRGLNSIKEYHDLLANNSGARDELYGDLLIGVTGFYRDVDAITAVRREAFATLADAEEESQPLRIWVPGCASGEEAYTMAIELTEALEEAGVKRKFRIIATDVHRRSIDIASAGLYSEESISNVPERIRQKYFLTHRNQYMVDPILRQKIIFSVHDVLSDPPFMHLDMISCRNLLIYLNDEAQARVISMFLFGLRKDGFMLLGPSESLGRFGPEFKVVNSRWRLFQKSSNHKIVDRSLLSTKINHRPRDDGWSRDDSRSTRPPAQTLAHDVAELRNRETLVRSYDALLKRYAPSSIIITADGDVLSWFGAASLFIDTMNNLADWTVEDIVHPDLHFTINVGMEKLRQGQLESYDRKINIDLGGGEKQTCTVTLEPLDQTTKHRFMLVTLTLERESGARTEERRSRSEAEPPSSSNEDVTLLTRRIQELERDLRLTEETLQHVTERLEASGEELQASNEELQASNEELQASNEELQSSNEELHAVNEELVSVSAEHERKIEMLSELNRNTEALLKLLGVGVIFVDHSIRIRRFSELIGAQFLLEAHDIDRPLSVVEPRFDSLNLTDLVAEVLETGESRSGKASYKTAEYDVEAHPTDSGDPELAPGAVLVIRGLKDPAG
ncbi:chemotaxis protein CheB [Pseudoroseicyclus sp. CXY001]|uniref:chemotaxis protein CheB n=1 Tax=Pseudoroseicyclus sp. CXY001 TaxID=3242492 RepID=UPI00357125EA